MTIWHWIRLMTLGVITLAFTGLIHLAFVPPAQAHWADVAIAEVQLQPNAAEVALTVPTGLLAIADTNQDQHLSSDEVQAHQTQLRQFLGDRVILKTISGSLPLTDVNLREATAIKAHPNLMISSHSTLQLHYDNAQRAEVTAISYHLFLPGVPTATCVATILNGKSSRQFIFSPETQELVLNSLANGLLGMPTWTALFAAFVWGAFHSLSPGHGKTIVGAYLTGAKATAQHALFLGLTTTVTHTTGVFLLGLVALFASQFVQIETVLPWLSVFSGVLIVCIGLQLLRDRFSRGKAHDHSHDHSHNHDQEPSPTQDHHMQEHAHSHGHTHHPAHSHEHLHHHGIPHSHPHDLARFEDEGTIRWGSLLAIGISGGLVPCPSALILLLSSIAFGQVVLGLTLVLAFSLGLAGVLTGLGLLLIYARKRFERVSVPSQWLSFLPTISAGVITLFGFGLTAKAVLSLNSSPV